MISLLIYDQNPLFYFKILQKKILLLYSKFIIIIKKIKKINIENNKYGTIKKNSFPFNRKFICFIIQSTNKLKLIKYCIKLTVKKKIQI